MPDQLVTSRERARLETFLGRYSAPRTVAAYRGDWNAIARWFKLATGKPFELERLTPETARQYRDFLIGHHRPHSANRRLLFLQRYASALGSKELAEHVAALKGPRQQATAPEGLEPRAVRAILLRLRRAPVRDRLIVQLLLRTGITPEELINLTKQDLIPGFLVVGRSNEKRRVPLRADLASALRAYGRDHRTARLFEGQKKGPFSYWELLRMVKAYTKSSPRELRHTFAYGYLRARPGDIVGLAELLGYSSLAAASVYFRRQQTDLRRAMGRMRFGCGS